MGGDTCGPERRFPHPYWIYSDPEIYPGSRSAFSAFELETTWAQAELAAPGDFKPTFIGEKPVVGGARRGRLDQRRRESLRHTGALQFCQKHSATFRVHVPITTTDLRLKAI